MSEKVDTIPQALKCRLCKEEATLGVWMYEAEHPENTFVCHDCWNIVTSMIEDLLPRMLHDFVEYGELHMKIKEVSVMRHVRVETNPVEVTTK